MDRGDALTSGDSPFVLALLKLVDQRATTAETLRVGDKVDAERVTCLLSEAELARALVAVARRQDLLARAFLDLGIEESVEYGVTERRRRAVARVEGMLEGATVEDHDATTG